MKLRRMKRFSFFGLLCFFLLAGSVGTNAAQIYDNGAPDLLNGFEMSNWIEADQFILTTGATVQGVKFWDLERLGFFQNTIPWAIYSNSGSNKPGNLIASGFSSNLTHILTGRTDGFGYIEFVNTFDISPVSLPAGTYWLALHNGPLSYRIQQVYWETANHPSAIPSQSDIAPFNGNWLANFSSNNPAPKLAFQLNGTVITPATLLSVASRKNHGSNIFEVPLPLTGSPGVECRTGGVNGDHDVVFKFANPVTFTATATCSGNPATTNTAGSEITVHCSGVTNIQTISVALNSAAGNFSAQMGILLGDTNASRSVNSTDISQTKGQSGQAVSASNFRTDITVSNSINATDVSMVKSNSGTALP